MSRTIPILTRRDLEQPSSGVAEVFFVTVTHPETSDVIRLVVDGVDYVLNGDTFHRSAFELDLLQDSDRPPSVPFRFPNVDRTAVAKLRLVNGPCRVMFEVYSSDYWDLSQDPRTVKAGLTPTPIYSARSLFLTEISADDVAVSGTLRSWDYTQESWPNKLATKALTPGGLRTMKGYVGVPFVDGGRDRAGWDCWGVVCVAYGEEAGIELPTYGEISAAELLRITRQMQSGATSETWRRVDAEPRQKLDVVLMKNIDRAGDIPVHVGIMRDHRTVIHVEAATDTVAVASSHPSICGRIMGYFRHRNLI